MTKTKRYLVTLFSVCGRKAAVVASRAIAKICLVLLIAQLGCAVQAVVLQPPPDAPVQTVEITAKKYSFAPAEIRVRKGTVVRLVYESLDTEHGVWIAQYGIDRDIPGAGRGSVTIELYASEVGTFTIRCSNFCGVGHPWMTGKLIVED